MMKKRNIIISKLRSKYWTLTHKYVVRLTNSVKESISLDKSNGNTLFWKSIVKEMGKVRIAFDIYEGNMEELPLGYHEVSCHIIFDVKMGDNFRCKS